jgi:hypothetical protein
MNADLKNGLNKLIALALKCVIYLIIIGGIIAIEQYASSGWIPHTRSVDMYMAPDWIIGEEQTCIAFQNQVPEISSIDCPVGDYSEKPHRIEIKFWGRVSRPEILNGPTSLETHFEWKCVRKEDGFVCWAIN